MDSNERLSLKEEKEKLENELSGLPNQQARLQEICKQLGEESRCIPTKNNWIQFCNNNGILKMCDLYIYFSK